MGEEAAVVVEQDPEPLASSIDLANRPAGKSATESSGGLGAKDTSIRRVCRGDDRSANLFLEAPSDQFYVG
jgi:hypothetical protein